MTCGWYTRWCPMQPPYVKRYSPKFENKDIAADIDALL